ncbi:diguanylate cyclase [Desulfovibrio mangrovi]|uniref:diguanylate cyclase domain-containing protein n=1 Tax=Desulfovibrio mangrovi TaxID=2976983 RepID=UPI0022456DAE|nr:diguanylate cyclase [Desulfovibrio mangrovi]UZP67362.1 diguanylate cyclase [Desulfovibrio mangrovi]
MDQPPKDTRQYGVSAVLIFVLATLAATLYQYVTSEILPQGSPLRLALPVAAGILATLFIRLLSARHCSRCPLPAENAEQREAQEKQQIELARQRRKTAEAERQAMALQRHAAESVHSDLAMKRHESRFQVAFHATPDPILFINADTGLVMDLNESFLHLLGISWREVMGAPIQDILHWHSQEDQDRYATLRQTGSVSNLRADIRDSGGRARQFLISARAIELDGVRSDIIIARDITDIESLRHELASKTELLESILRHIPYYIFWKDTNHHYLGANALFRSAFPNAALQRVEDFADDELDNRMLRKSPHTQGTRQEDQHVMASGVPIINAERSMFINEEGQPPRQADVLVSKVPLRDNQGSISGMLGIIADVSDLRQQERQFLMLLNGIPDPAWIKDAEGRYSVANRALGELLGKAPADLAGLTDNDLLPEEMARRCSANERAVVQTGMPLRNDELCQTNGKSKWFEVIRQPLTEETPEGFIRVLGTMGIARDISERRKAEDEIRTLSRAIEQSSTAVAITTREGIVEYVNPRYTEITGLLPAQAHNRQPAILHSLPEITPDEVWKLIQCGEQWRGEFEYARKGGASCWLLASISPVMNDAGSILNALIVLDDITQRKEQEEYIRFMAMNDGLTSLPNRRLFMNRLRQAAAMYQRDNTPFALLFLDLNNFKEINDTLGHDAGDLVLKTIADRISESLREVDFAARLGGDEFVVLLHNIRNETEIHKAATRIAEAVRLPVTINGQERQVETAIGIALCPQHGTDPDSLLTMADKAMYQCKSAPQVPYITSEIQSEYGN